MHSAEGFGTPPPVGGGISFGSGAPPQGTGVVDLLPSEAFQRPSSSKVPLNCNLQSSASGAVSSTRGAAEGRDVAAPNEAGAAEDLEDRDQDDGGYEEYALMAPR